MTRQAHRARLHPMNIEINGKMPENPNGFVEKRKNINIAKRSSTKNTPSTYSVYIIYIWYVHCKYSAFSRSFTQSAAKHYDICTRLQRAAVWVCKSREIRNKKSIIAVAMMLIIVWTQFLRRPIPNDCLACRSWWEFLRIHAINEWNVALISCHFKRYFDEHLCALSNLLMTNHFYSTTHIPSRLTPGSRAIIEHIKFRFELPFSIQPFGSPAPPFEVTVNSSLQTTIDHEFSNHKNTTQNGTT